MKIQTKYLGEIEIEKDQIIRFPSGIPGFLEEKEFVLLHIPDNPVFQFLQSVKTTELAFVVTSPYHFYPNYTIKLDDMILDFLEITNKEEVLLLAILTLREPFDTSTINLKAPLVINQRKKLGKQYIIQSDEYQSKASIKPVVTEEGV